MNILTVEYWYKTPPVVSIHTASTPNARSKTTPFYILLLLKAAGHGRHADERVRRDDGDVLVKLHHKRLELFRHLPRVPAMQDNIWF